MASGLLAALPHEALRCCLAFLRATELGSGLAASCDALRCCCQRPELWRDEVLRRFPSVVAQAVAKDGRQLSWRTTCVRTLWRQYFKTRSQCFVSEQRLRGELQEVQALRNRLLDETKHLKQIRADLQDKLQEVRQRAAESDSFFTSGSASGDVRAKSKIYWEEVQEVRRACAKVDGDLSELASKLTASAPAGIERVKALSAALANRKAAQGFADEALAKLPSALTEGLAHEMSPLSIARNGDKASPAWQVPGASRLAALAGERAASSAASHARRRVLQRDLSSSSLVARTMDTSSSASTSAPASMGARRQFT